MDLNDAYARYEQDQDKDALLIEVHRFAIAKARKRNQSDPEDLANDIVIRIIETFHSFDPKRGNFRAWVATLANNYLASAHRSAKRQTVPDQEPEDITLEELEPDYPDVDDRKPQDLRELPPEVSRIAAMLQLGYSKSETAQKIGVSVRRLEQITKNYIDKKAA